MKDFSSHYSKALFAVAKETKCEDKIYEDLKTAAEIFDQNPYITDRLTYPEITLKDRLSVIDEAFCDANIYVKNFIKLLCEKGRLSKLFKCFESYEKLYFKDKGIEKVTAVTAIPVSGEMSERVLEKLSEKLRKKVILKCEVDKKILGGIIIKTENFRIDASLRKRLDGIKKAILK